MTSPRPIWLAALALLAVAAAPVRDAAVQASMAAVVAPASDLVFAVGGEVDPDNGPSAPAVPDARWAAAGRSAEKLKSAAALMLEPAHVQAGGWKDDAIRMAALSDQARAATATHEGKALTQAANDLGDVCSSCHAAYKPNG